MTKRALVLEGGGMRGAHTCGALMALKDRGLDHFDVVAASSAGALTVAFFVARQFHLFPSVWVDYLHDGTFLNFRNVTRRGRHIMDIDYLVDGVFGEKVVLDYAAIRKSPTDFFITATDCQTGDPVYLEAKKVDIPLALKITASMPLVYRQIHYWEGRRLIDGGIADSIPIAKALREGCDEILVLSTRPRGFRKKPIRATFWIPWFFKEYPHFGWAMKVRHRRYNQTVELIERLEKKGKVTVIGPEKDLPLTRLTSDQDKLKLAVEIGYRDVLRVLSNSPKIP